MMKQLITLFMVAASIAFSNAQPRFDALHPDVHDPVMAKGEDGRYYIFTTGFNVGVISSADLKEWRREPSAFKQVPEWAPQQVRGFRGHTWAPDISYHNGQWYLYYSCSCLCAVTPCRQRRNSRFTGLAAARHFTLRHVPVIA